VEIMLAVARDEVNAEALATCLMPRERQWVA